MTLYTKYAPGGSSGGSGGGGGGISTGTVLVNGIGKNGIGNYVSIMFN